MVNITQKISLKGDAAWSIRLSNQARLTTEEFHTGTIRTDRVTTGDLHYCSLATSGANLYPPGAWFADVMMSFSGVTIVVFCFVFVFMLSLKPRPFVQSFLDYAGAPIATRVYFFFLLFIWT